MNCQPEQDPYGLERRASGGSMQRFNHVDDKELWDSLEAPERILTYPDCKKFEDLTNKLDQKYPIPSTSPERQKRLQGDRKNVLKKLLRVQDVLFGCVFTLHTFIQMTKAIGPFREVNTGVDDRRTCVFLEQLRNISTNSKEGRGADGHQLSWFAGNMTSSEAEEKLMVGRNPPGTFLIRFSEGLSDEGAYALSVIAIDGRIRHFNIVGKPSEAASSHPYHCQLKLLHNENEELNSQEGTYGDIVIFRRERLQGRAVIEDEVYCTKICPGLPLNGEFTGYS